MAREDRVVGRLAGLRVDDAEHLVDGLSCRLGGGPAGERLGRRVEAHHHARRVAGDHAVADGAQGGGEMLLVLAQCLLLVADARVGAAQRDKEKRYQPGQCEKPHRYRHREHPPEGRRLGTDIQEDDQIAHFRAGNVLQRRNEHAPLLLAEFGVGARVTDLVPGFPGFLDKAITGGGQRA